jgi:hypothetical protein
MIIHDMEDPGHPLRTDVDSDPSHQRKVAQALKEVIHLITDAGDRFAVSHGIVIAS